MDEELEKKLGENIHILLTLKILEDKIMAKVFGQSADLSGNVGNVTYAQTKYGTIAYRRRKKAKVPRRSEKQMLVRMQWVNLAAVYKQYRQTLKKAYEDVVSSGSMSVYNAFVQANMNVNEVYVPKKVRLNGGSVLAPYQITRGTLDSIFYNKNAQNVLVTDVELGSLVIDGETTVASFAAAMISHNSDWQKGDQLTFFYGVQMIDPVSGVPRAKITGYKVMLDLTDQTPLWNIVSALGFSTVGTKLGMSQVITDGSAAWIHSREASDGSLKVGTQYMYVDSTVLASFQGDAAFEASVNSYGGINSAAVYLQPDEKTNLGGGNSGGNGGSGSETGGGGNENQNQNENQCGGSSTGSETGGGQQTATVAAPTFSGATQFTETTQVTMSGPEGASIFYTLDGSTPTDQSLEYEEPITLSATTTVKAIAIKDGVSSSVTTRVFTKGTNSGGGDGEE